MYIDGFAKFLVIFVQKYFLPLFKKKKKKKRDKTLFGNFSKIYTTFNQKSDDLIDSLWNSLPEMYTSFYVLVEFYLLVFK